MDSKLKESVWEIELWVYNFNVQKQNNINVILDDTTCAGIVNLCHCYLSIE